VQGHIQRRHDHVAKKRKDIRVLAVYGHDSDKNRFVARYAMYVPKGAKSEDIIKAAAVWGFAKWRVVSKQLRELIACAWIKCTAAWGYHRFQMMRGADSFYECLIEHLRVR